MEARQAAAAGPVRGLGTQQIYTTTKKSHRFLGGFLGGGVYHFVAMCSKMVYTTTQRITQEIVLFLGGGVYVLCP